MTGLTDWEGIRTMRQHSRRNFLSSSVAAVAVAGCTGQPDQRGSSESEQAITTNTIAEAEKIRSRLHQQLSEPVQKKKLLDDPASWQGKLQEADNSLRQARLLIDAAGGEVDPGLTAELHNLRLLMKSVESELKQR